MSATILAHDKIQTLKVKATEGDTPGLRLALMQNLASVNLHPAGMSPSAVFMIHYLQDPLPGGLMNRTQHSAAWRGALRTNLDQLYRQAATPTNCTLSGNPAAVLFRDQAELLACLIVDICAQRVGQHWWWRNRYFSSGDCSQRIRETLVHDVRYIPAMFSHLASAGKALEVVKRLEPSHAGDILQMLLREFSLDTVHQFIADAEHESDQIEIPAAIHLKKSGVSAQQRSPIKPAHAIPPWATLLSEVSWQAGLQRAQAALLGIARTLHERPAMMRNRIFQRSLAHWWASEQLPTATKPLAVGRMQMKEHQQSRFLKKNSQGQTSDLDTDNTSKNFPNRITTLQPLQNVNSAGSQHAFTKERSADNNSDGKPGVISEVFSPAADKKNRNKQFFPNDKTKKIEILNGCDSTTGMDKTSTRKIEDPIAHGDNAGLTQFQDGATPQNLLASSKTIATDNNILPEEYLKNSNEVNLHFSDTFIDTRLGGIIFLINLIHQLGLPGCFDKRWQLEQQLSPWALVDLFARALLGNRFASFYADPIWRVLAKLDGRRTKLQIAKKFCGDPDYRIPYSWYEWLQVEQFFWASSRNKIRIWTASCILVETTFSGDPLTACTTEMRAYDPHFNPAWLQSAAYGDAPRASSAQLQTCGINAALARWLALITPFVFRFLGHQLQRPATRKRELFSELLYLDARIYLSSSHIDLVTGIDNTRFALRCAGLDQDPGWLPDYGRVVLIHFS